MPSTVEQLRAAKAWMVNTRMEMRKEALFAAVPPTSPPAQYWLISDAGPSYCRECCIKERVKEFGFGMAPMEYRYRHWLGNCAEDASRAFWDGIDSVRTYCTSDGPVWCDVCGLLLSYFLDSDDSVAQEMEHFNSHPNAGFDADISHEVHQLLINSHWTDPRWRILGGCKIVKQAVRAIADAEQAEVQS